MSTEQGQLMNPEGQTPPSTSATTGRAGDLAGKTIGLFWNGKAGGDVFLDEVGRQLAARFAGLKLLKIWEVRPETTTFLGNSAQSLDYMARSADLIIGCSAD